MPTVIWNVEGRPPESRGGGCCCLGIFLLAVFALAAIIWFALAMEDDTPPPEAEQRVEEPQAPSVEALAESDLADALDRRGTFVFEGTRLERALELLAEKAGLELRILESAEPFMDEPVRWSASSATVREALAHLAEERDLSFRISDEERTLIVRSRGAALREIDPGESLREQP